MKAFNPTTLTRRAFTAMLPLLLLTVNCRQADTEANAQVNIDKGFPKTYRAVALQRAALPKIVETHPRLFVRSDPWPHGPSLRELKEWSKSAPLKTYLSGAPWEREPYLEWAFRYLVTGNEALVQPIIENMKSQKGYWPGYLTTLATTYDWLYNSPSFRAEDKRLIEDKIVDWGNAAIGAGEHYQDMWSHFAYGPVTDMAAAGLALYGHRKEAEDFLALAGGYLKNTFMPAWQINDGAWQGGWTYYSQGPAKLITLIHLWSAGTDEDLYKIIADSQGDWLRKHLLFMLSSSYGKSGPLETGGFSYAPDVNGILEGALPITYAYQDANGIAAFRILETIPWWAKIWQFIFYSPGMYSRIAAGSSIPLSQLWGRDGVGYAQMRSGWGDRDTLIDFKCGDYFWSHQFQNQNSFTIYHGGELAVQSGIYDAYYGPHMQSYYRPTIGSNSMLVIQPGETTWIPPGVANENGIRSDNGYFPEWGGQRSCYMLPDFGSAETCFSFERYLYRKNHEHHFETGTMQSWEASERYTYASGDATMAYNNPKFSYPGNKPKLDHASRDLLFLDKKYLLVFDRVNALDPSYEKRWLLHTITEPKVNSQIIDEKVPGHIVSFEPGVVRIDRDEGTLFLKPLFPENSKLSIVGGGVSMTEIQPAPANRGNARIDRIVTGPYAAMGGTIATDAAGVEEWSIKLISDIDFTVFGSKTGADGQGNITQNFFSNSYSLFIPRDNWKGVPKKGDLYTFKTTSPSYRFWVNGENRLPNIKKLVHIIEDGSKVHPGNYRIEVAPARAKNFDSFLHFLYPCDRNTAEMPLVLSMQSQNDLLEGLTVADWAVMFRVRGSLNSVTRYKVPSKSAKEHLVLGLEPDKQFRVIVRQVDGSKEQIHTLKVSKEGVLSFKADSPAEIELTPLSAF